MSVVSESEDRRKELELLRGTLIRNVYPEWILRDLIDDSSNESEEEMETSEETMKISEKERSKKIPAVIPHKKRVLGTTEVGVREHRLLQTNKHNEAIVGKTEGPGEQRERGRTCV